jgi:hypothetical protein
MKTFVFAAFAVAALAVPTAVQAHGGPPAIVDTNIVSLEETVPFDGPCTGPGIVSIDYNAVFHLTEFADGHSVFKFNQAGTFAFDPATPGQLSSTGHFRNGSTTVATQNTFSDTSVFVVNGRDTAGDRVSFRIRTAIVVANGELRVDTVDIECG